MDCKIFRKRLTDLIEDNISHDLKDVMLDHITECEACRLLYEEELSIDEVIKKGLSIDPTSFRSLRGDIMKNIDKNKYGTSPMKKIINHFKKYRITYTSAAAIITAAVLITPLLDTTNIGFGAKKSESKQNKELVSSAVDSASGAADQKMSQPQVQGKSDIESAGANQSFEMRNLVEYSPKFEKKSLDKGFKPSFNTPWEDSISKKYSATVEGKGAEAFEEGIGVIVLKDIKAGTQWSYSLLDNEQKQFTPKNLKWIDDENLLVVIGYGYGMVDFGGEVYFLNINTNEITKADPQNAAKTSKTSQITKILSVKTLPSKELEVNIEVLVYEDENLNANHRENRTIVIPFK
jgi:hypothetical protein